jgi:hypothetical protein
MLDVVLHQTTEAAEEGGWSSSGPSLDTGSRRQSQHARLRQ